jgi:hypothetical protein
VIVRSSKFLLLFLAATMLGAGLFALVAAWQLSRGPISLSFLTPYVENALSGGTDDVQVRLHDTVITWAGFERTLDLRAVGLEILDVDGVVGAAVPEMAVQLSLRALFRGLIAPTGLELFGPRLRVVRTPDGDIFVGIGAVSASEQPAGDGMDLIGRLLDEPDLNSSTGYLRRISVASALIDFEDRQTGRSWTAQRADIALRRDESGIQADGTIVLDAGGNFARFEVSGLLNAITQSVELGVSFDNLQPADLAPLDQRLTPLERFKLPVSGTLALSLSASLAIEDVNFDLSGGAGEIAAPEYYKAPLPVTQVMLRGRATDALTKLIIEEASVGLGGPVVRVSGDVSRQGEALEIKLDTRIEAVPANQLAKLWPRDVATNARTWIVKNIKDGVVDAATMSMAATTSLDDIEAIKLRDAVGEIDLRGMTIHYLRPMPPVQNVSGKGRFDGKDLVIDVREGGIGETRVVAGKVAITDLTGSAPIETLRIDATIAGPVRQALALLDEEPLNFISPFGIDPAQTSGGHTTEVVLRFPLLDALSFEEVDVAAAARLENIVAPAGVFGANITQGNFDLTVNKKNLIAKGEGALSGIPMKVTWTENFTDETALRTRYEVQTVLNDSARETLGLAADPVLTGPVGVGFTYEIGTDGSEKGAANLNLADATLALLDFGWQKPVGVPGSATVEILGRDGVLSEISKFAVTAPGLSAEGRATLVSGADGPTVSEVDLSRLVLGETDVALRVKFGDDGVPDIVVGGGNLDLRLLVQDVFAEGDGKPPAMRIRTDDDNPVRNIRLGEETILQNPTGRLAHNGEDWSDIDLLGSLSNAGTIDLQLRTVNGQREVSLESNDGGGILAALDWITTIEGGDLKVIGSFIQRADEEVLVGQLDLKDFKLNESSIFVRVLSLASFSGISDAVAGTGVTIRRAEIPFEVTDAEVLFGDSKARGAGVGIIGSGRIDRASEQIEIKGEIALADVINSILRNIPLIELLVGDGIIAVGYSVKGPLSDPNVSVNPLTAFVPGVFRRAFDGFGVGEGVGEGSTEQPTEPPVSD